MTPPKCSRCDDRGFVDYAGFCMDPCPLCTTEKDMNTLPQATVEAMTPQLRLVYDYLMTGRSLTPQIAMNTLNIQSLTTRIAELRKLKLDVSSKWKRTSPVGDFRMSRYKSYWVDGAGNGGA